MTQYGRFHARVAEAAIFSLQRPQGFVAIQLVGYLDAGHFKLILLLFRHVVERIVEILGADEKGAGEHDAVFIRRRMAQDLIVKDSVRVCRNLRLSFSCSLFSQSIASR